MNKEFTQEFDKPISKTPKGGATKKDNDSVAVVVIMTLITIGIVMIVYNQNKTNLTIIDKLTALQNQIPKIVSDKNDAQIKNKEPQEKNKKI